MTTWIRAAAAALFGLWAAATFGCAEERAPINRVQANALAKTFFVGEDLTALEDDPEFYYRGTIVDVGYGAGQNGLFTSTWAQPVSRVKWEITETLLNARLAYERIEGTDEKGAPSLEGFEKLANDGQIVASFVITSHFDIRRDYNAATGEESNIIVENTNDRPWNQRSYMRVDWSRNLVTSSYDFDTLSQIGLYGGVEYEPVGYYVNDPAHPDAPHFDPQAGYFDVTTKVFATPQMIDLSSLGWGIDKFPACMLPGDFSGGTEPWGNCNAQEITIRHSFRRVDDGDYAAVDFDGSRFQAFGVFNFDFRRAYERNYGLVDDKFYRFAARYNVWKRSHYFADPEARTGEVACATEESTAIPTGDPTADPNRDLGHLDGSGALMDGPNGTADECEAVGPGSRCDVFRKRCTLPFMARETKVIPWYIGGDSTEDLFEATEWAVEEWDLAMKTAVQTSRLVECRRTGQADCDARFPMWRGQQDDIDDAVEIVRDQTRCLRAAGWNPEACHGLVDEGTARLAAERGDPADRDVAAMNTILKMPSVIVLCHAPPGDNDHAACGSGDDVRPRLGDLRFNTVLVIENPQTPSSWGIMVDADDPLSGEKVAASINIWSAVTDVAAQSLVDLVRYINGELSTDQITNGEYVRDWVRAERLSAPAAGPKMTPAEVAARVASVTKLGGAALSALESSTTLPQLRQLMREKNRELGDVATAADIASPQAIDVRARLAAARGSKVEAALMNRAMLDLAGVDELDVPTQGPIADAASPLAGNDPRVRSELRKRRETSLAARGACVLHEAPEPTAMPGLAAALLRKFPIPEAESPAMAKQRHERMFNYVRRRYQYAVISHEMGHSIGLRHNFVSSYASLHFRPQYWQLRTKDGTVTEPCTGASGEDPEQCVGPRYFDQLTADEEQQMIWMYQHSSVMDYPGDVSQDLLGLGIYDMAAARFFYGDVVSVYDGPDERYRAGGDVATGLLSTIDNFGGLAGIKYATGRGNASRELHYSEIQKEYQVLTRCYPTALQPPAWWNVERDGEWDPVTDGKRITLDGGATYTKCRQQPVDYVGWLDLRHPTEQELDSSFYRGGPAVHDPTGRIRVPYSFATDHWADTGNVSVFRHDNGADPYEQMLFLVNTHENRHIFDNFRRNRSTFTVRGAADRSFSRYSEKMQGIAGGIGFYGTIYQDLATNQGISFDTLWPLLVSSSLHDNVVAATVAFDHFTRLLSRPQPGEHYLRAPAFADPVLRSNDDPDDYGAGASLGGPIENSGVLVLVPNGSTGYLKDVGFGGRPLNNAYATEYGDFNTEYTVWAGSYYDKINTAILLAESEDRFVSSSRRDFYDARFRAVGMADVLPEGFRRVIGNALTGDRWALAPQLAAQGGEPMLDENPPPGPDTQASMYPARPLGWKTWWPNEGPRTCFPSGGRLACFDYIGGDFDPAGVDETIGVDPQVGWEVQKFVIAWTLAHIPANEKAYWLDQMRVYRLGHDDDPQFEERIEWQDPASGQIYYARTYGMECLFGNGTSRNACVSSGGKWVQKGIAARVLEWTNFLTSRGYQLDPAYSSADYGVGFDDNGRARVMMHLDGTPIVVPDPAIYDISPQGDALLPVPPCDTNVDPSCEPLSVYKNHYAYELVGYKSVPDYLQEVLLEYGLNDPQELGIY